MDIALWLLSPGVVRPYVMKMSSKLPHLVGVVIICSVWVVRTFLRSVYLRKE